MMFEDPDIDTVASQRIFKFQKVPQNLILRYWYWLYAKVKRGTPYGEI